MFEIKNQRQIFNSKPINFLWAASMTLKMSTPKIYLFSFSLKTIVETWVSYQILVTNPLDGRNTKKLKNQKLKLLIFFVSIHISVNFFQKKPK